MAATIRNLVTVYCCGFILIQIGSVQPELINGLLGTVGDLTNDIVSSSILSNVTSILQSPLTRQLCGAETDELCAYYGYEPETHSITTDDGYILKLFRCNSKKSPGNGKVVVLHHGFLVSSDDFTMNIPSQALAYVMADQGYDVWLPNHRGNYYSRRHVSKDPNNHQSGFWNFSWDSIAFHDYPAIYEYIREQTGISKFNIVAHSQGTSSMLALLSKKPEYNEYMSAVSLMGPITYLNNAYVLFELLGKLQGPLELTENIELLPRGVLNDLLGTVCLSVAADVCNTALNLIFGPGHDKNETMVPTYLCHTPCGVSSTQLLHYGQEIDHSYFGERMTSSEVPPDFPLNRITAPISVHYSPVDPFTDPRDVRTLTSKLNGTEDLFVQTVDQIKFNHLDFIWGIHANELVYSQILNFFKKHENN